MYEELQQQQQAQSLEASAAQVQNSASATSWDPAALHKYVINYCDLEACRQEGGWPGYIRGEAIGLPKAMFTLAN